MDNMDNVRKVNISETGIGEEGFGDAAETMPTIDERVEAVAKPAEEIKLWKIRCNDQVTAKEIGAIINSMRIAADLGTKRGLDMSPGIDFIPLKGVDCPVPRKKS